MLTLFFVIICWFCNNFSVHSEYATVLWTLVMEVDHRYAAFGQNWDQDFKKCKCIKNRELNVFLMSSLALLTLAFRNMCLVILAFYVTVIIMLLKT